MATLTNFLKLYKAVANEIGWDDNMNSNLDILDGYIQQFANVPGFVGVWTNATAYAIGQVTIDGANGSFYKCLIANTSAVAPTTFAQDRTNRPTLWALDSNPLQSAADAAAASAAAAAASAASSAASLTSFTNTYYGPFATDPLNDPHGGVRTAGDLYFNTTTNRMRVYVGAPTNAWVEITTTAPDVPTSPAATTYGRTDLHTWVPVVPASGGTFTGPMSFTGDVIVGGAGRLGVGVFPPVAAFAGTAFTSHLYSSTIISINLYLDKTAPNPWRYTVSNPATIPTAGTGVGALLLTTNTLPGNVRQVNFFTTASPEAVVANNPASLQTFLQAVSSVLNGGPTVRVFGVAEKPGGGVWSALTSDARTKTIIGPYPHGLAELLEMLPQMYTYKGNAQFVGPDGGPGDVINPDTTTQYIGLIAQDCEPYMPELVTETTAYIDGVLQNDVRQLDATGVIYALVNAVAELNTKSVDDGGIINGRVDLNQPTDTGLTINSSTVAPVLQFNGNTATATVGYIGARRNGLDRWGIALGNAGAETGANAGSPFVINRFSDAGPVITPSALVINRADAKATFGGAIATGATGGANNITITPGASATANITINGSGTGSFAFNSSATFSGIVQVTGLQSNGGIGGTGALNMTGSSANTFGTIGLNNALSITPGSTAATQIAIAASGTGGIQYGATGGKAAFLGATPVARPAVTGSRGGNAALASLITALASLGLVTDSSTA